MSIPVSPVVVRLSQMRIQEHQNCPYCGNPVIMTEKFKRCIKAGSGDSVQIG